MLEWTLVCLEEVRDCLARLLESTLVWCSTQTPTGAWPILLFMSASSKLTSSTSKSMPQNCNNTQRKWLHAFTHYVVRAHGWLLLMLASLCTSYLQTGNRLSKLRSCHILLLSWCLTLLCLLTVVTHLMLLFAAFACCCHSLSAVDKNCCCLLLLLSCCSMLPCLLA